MTYKEAIKVIKDRWKIDCLPVDLWIALDVVLFKNKTFTKRHNTTIIGEMYMSLPPKKRRIAQQFLRFLQDRTD